MKIHEKKSGPPPVGPRSPETPAPPPPKNADVSSMMVVTMTCSLFLKTPKRLTYSHLVLDAAWRRSKKEALICEYVCVCRHPTYSGRQSTYIFRYVLGGRITWGWLSRTGGRNVNTGAFFLQRGKTMCCLPNTTAAVPRYT